MRTARSRARTASSFISSGMSTGRTPPRVVIDEAVKLAHWFAGGKSPAFVNGVLDSLARELGRL